MTDVVPLGASPSFTSFTFRVCDDGHHGFLEVPTQQRKRILQFTFREGLLNSDRLGALSSLGRINRLGRSVQICPACGILIAGLFRNSALLLLAFLRRAIAPDPGPCQYPNPLYRS